MGVTPETVRRLVSAGVLVADRVGGELCFDVAEIERYVRRRRGCGIR